MTLCGPACTKQNYRSRAVNPQRRCLRRQGRLKETILCEVSTYDSHDEQRWFAEEPKNPHRTSFERDRARVVHSSALRRLGSKTQVLGPGTDDFVRTRLTHSLEVAQVGRELGKSLGCDPDIVDAACLSHDLGHPPFGHNGEAALDLAALSIGGFEGNAQTLRLLTRLEPKAFMEDGTSAGLNLTRASIDASIKYPWRAQDALLRNDGTKSPKFGVYEADLPAFKWVREGAPEGRLCLEAQVMDLSDDVSYSVHDVEDGIVGGRIPAGVLWQEEHFEAILQHISDWYSPRLSEAQLLEAMKRLRSLPSWPTQYDGSRQALGRLKDLTSSLIGRFALSAAQATRAKFGDGPLIRFDADLIVPDEIEAEIVVLKGLAATFIMAPREIEPTYLKQRTILVELVEVLAEKPEHLEPQFAADYAHADTADDRLRVVVDQVASLTDDSAIALHHLLRGVDSTASYMNAN